MNTTSHFDLTASRYETVARTRPEFEERFSIFKRRIDTIWDEAGGQNAVAIDLGCGSGELSWYLAKKGFETVGVDGSGAMLAHARQQAQRHGIKGITFLQRNLPLDDVSDVVPPRTATLVVCSSVLEYIERDQDVLNQCSVLLADHGYALISLPNRRSPYWALQRLLRETPIFRTSDSHYQRHQYSPDGFRESAARAGLGVVDVDYFALPMQRKLPHSWRRRPPWAALMFLATLTRVPDTRGLGSGRSLGR